jgi:hypothetical protein
LKKVQNTGPCGRKTKMPNYTKYCVDCESRSVDYHPIATGPIDGECVKCGGITKHDFTADVMTQEHCLAGCRDHNEIPREKRAFRQGSRADADRKEAAYRKGIQQRRQELKGGNRGSIRQTHAIPADLHAGKIRETKDPNYWQDPTNMKRHDAFKVN